MDRHLIKNSRKIQITPADDIQAHYTSNIEKFYRTKDI